MKALRTDTVPGSGAGAGGVCGVGAVGVESGGEGGAEGEEETACVGWVSKVMSLGAGVDRLGSRGGGMKESVPKAQKTTKENVFPNVHSIIPPSVISSPPMK